MSQPFRSCRPTLIAAALLLAGMADVHAATRDIDSVMPRVGITRQATSSRALTSASSDYRQFRSQAATRTYDTVLRSDPAIKASRSEFARMQAYLANTYDGLTVTSTYTVGGATFDCIPVDQQPSLRGGVPLVAPPPGAKTTNGGTSAYRCATGNVPFRRITIEELASHPTLEDFLSKPSASAVDPNQHYYSHVAQTRPMAMIGGGAGLNLWKPVVDNRTMSLLQIWLVGDSTGGVQTAEAGWQVQPGAWQTYDPTVFEYWTADGYASTGCYNLGCTGFVQYATDFSLGSAIPSDRYSVAGGAQTIMNVEWVRQDGQDVWWLNVDGEYVGYLPASLYGQGNMGIANGVRRMDAGGEIARDGLPSAAMGSGQFASTGYQHAAFVTNEHYLDSSWTQHPVDLTARDTWLNATPSCYTLSLIGVTPGQLPGTLPDGVSTTPTLQSGMTGTSFYLGGPGTANAACNAAHPASTVATASR